MCNLYSLTKGQDAIRQLTKAMRDTTGNLPLLPGVFPDYLAPIVRTAEDGVRELTTARCGMPSPAFTLEGKKVDKGVTNIRNVGSAHWRRWTAPASRCVVPFTSFSENDKLPGGRFEPVWFALDERRPLAVFAGVWTPWTCTRKLAEGEVTCSLYAFLTTDANAEVGAVHPKAMPVILTEPDEIETWLTAPWDEACGLQRPLPDDALTVVAHGEKKDAPADLLAVFCHERAGDRLTLEIFRENKQGTTGATEPSRPMKDASSVPAIDAFREQIRRIETVGLKATTSCRSGWTRSTRSYRVVAWRSARWTKWLAETSVPSPARRDRCSGA